MKQAEKTNVMRLLDVNNISYKWYTYECEEPVKGTEIARQLNEDPEHVFKTLATIGQSKTIYIFMIPVGNELNLKKAARAVNEKNIEMLKSKDLLNTVGYVHGATSPIGLKKNFKITIDETAILFDTIIFSGGKIGYQVELSLEELKKLVNYQLVDVID